LNINTLTEEIVEMKHRQPFRRMARLVLNRLAACLLGCMAFAAVAAEALGPEQLVRAVTEQVLAAIAQDPTLRAGDRTAALALAEARILPHVDFAEAAKLAAGRAWTTATPEQRERLVKEFRSMLVRTYSVAISAYRGQTMAVLPLQMAADATDVTVRSRYLSPGAPPVNVSYAMHKTADGWKIYDISVEGVSLVLTYRSEFEQIGRESGIEGLIARLAEKNRSSTAG
jgi:phospholipid transport system substrate-binding protein